MSDSDRKPGNGLRDTIHVSLWCIAFLFLYDVGVNVVFARPDHPDATPNSLQAYFDYGRSVEGKIEHLVEKSRKAKKNLAHSGFIDWEVGKPQPVDASATVRISAYGQSFTRRLCNLMKKMSDDVSLRVIAGPGAPLNHSYACYLADTRRDTNVAMIGILASSLTTSQSMTDMTRSFERPFPYGYPRYYVEEGALKSRTLGLRSLDRFIAVLEDEAKWEAMVGDLKEHDPFYWGFLFRKSILDRSSTFRMVRRSIAQTHIRGTRARYVGKDGFVDDDGLLTETKAIVTEFGRVARSRGQTPVILLFNNKGYADYLFRALSPTLEAEKIRFMSTHEIAPASDLTLFLPDGHFIPRTEKVMARKVLEFLGANPK